MGFIPVIHMTELVKVGNISDFKENELTSFNVEGIELMGTIIDGQYHVTSRICSHKYFDLPYLLTLDKALTEETK